MAKKRASESITRTHKTTNIGWIKWTGSKARARLLEDLNGGKLALENAELSVEDAWEFYKKEEGFGQVVFTQFKARLKDHRKQVKEKKDKEQSTAPKKEGWIDWRSKNAQAPKNMIIEDLVQGILPLEDSEMSAEEAWTHYEKEEAFENIVFGQFKERLVAHRKQVKKSIARSRY